MLNLNKKLISKKELLKYIEDIDVYRLYTGQDADLAITIISPLREESNPSFGYFVGETSEICFNDFKLGTGDFIKFVELFFGCSFFDALCQIAVDFNLQNHFINCKSLPKFKKGFREGNFKNREEIIKNKKKTALGVRSREWSAHDIIYWHQFGITRSILELYRVKPIDYIFFSANEPAVKADKYAYVFYEKKDYKNTIKIYQPFSPAYKWFNNHDDSVWQGWEQLPEKGDSLVITKSLKDVMSIVSVLGVNSVALQSESVRPKQSILDELDKRFVTKLLLYDNDFDKPTNFGREKGAAIVDEQYIHQIEIPTKFQCKDFSDLVKKYGKNKAKEIYKTSIEIPF